MPLTREAAARKDATNGKADLKLQHRHFAFIADAVASIPDKNAREHAAFAFAGKLSDTNPNFDRKRFLTACNV